MDTEHPDESTEKHSAASVPDRVVPGLALLLNAHRYAAELKRDPWDLAVEIARLRAVGLDLCEFRWLVCREAVEHARETTLPGDLGGRAFRTEGALMFSRRTCFILTPAGVRTAEQVVQRAANHPVTSATNNQAPGRWTGGNCHVNGETPGSYRANGAGRPRWDSLRRQLLMGDKIVKEYKLNSPNQETVLMVFEEEGWPARIDDPLPPHPELDSKQRLHDTIKSLNRNQKSRAIRFMGDGTGLAIRWEAIPPNQ